MAYWRELGNAYDLPKAVLLTAGAWGILLGAALVTRASRPAPCIPREALGLVIFLVLAGVSALGAAAPAQAVGPLAGLLAALAWWLVGLLLLSPIARLATLLLALALPAAVAAALGILQWAGRDHWEWPAAAPDWIRGLPRPFSSLPMTDAPGSVFGHVNVAAEFVVLGLLALLGHVFACCSWRQRRGRGRLLFAIPLSGVMITFLVVSGTRASWLALLGGLGVLGCLAWLGRRREQERRAPRRGRLALVLAALVAALVIGDRLLLVPGRGGGPDEHPSERLLALGDLGTGTTAERLVLWSNTLRMIGADPVLGVGPGNWKIAYPAWARASRVHPHDRFTMLRQPERAHNDLLQVVAETGILGALALLSFLAPALLRLVRGAARPGPEGRILGAGLAVVAGAVCMSLVAFPFEDAVPGPVVFLVLGAAAAAAPGRGWSPGPRGLLWLAALSLVMLLALLLNGRARLTAELEYTRATLRHDQALQLAALGTLDPAAVRALHLESLDAADHAAARDPGGYRHQLRRANSLMFLGLADAAGQAYERCLELHPNLVQPMVALSNLYRQRGDWARARILFSRALGIMPDDPDVRLTAALYFHLRSYTHDARERRGRSDRDADRNAARRHYERSLELREHNPDARLGLVQLLLESGEQPLRVVAELQRARTECWGDTRRPGGNDFERLARCARIAADPRLEALGMMFGPEGEIPDRWWRRVIVLSHGAHVGARLEVELRAFRRALKGGPMPPAAELVRLTAVVRSILEAEPSNLRGLYYLARLQEAGQRPREALLTWGRLLRTAGRLPWMPPEISWLQDQALAARERLLKALDDG